MKSENLNLNSLQIILNIDTIKVITVKKIIFLTVHHRTGPPKNPLGQLYAFIIKAPNCITPQKLGKYVGQYS